MAFFSSRRQPEQPEHEERDVPRAASPIGFETVLGANAAMEGVLSSTGNVRMDGTFTGTLHITGNILVGETAKINADIDARNISIAGAVRGNVTGNKVQILRTGRIWGDIHATALATEEGAFIDGRITMKGHAANVPAEPPAPAEKPAIAEKPSNPNPILTIPRPDVHTESPVEEADFSDTKPEETAASRSDLEPTLPFPPEALKRDLQSAASAPEVTPSEDKGES
jgi:cytoskeletal protein CcmA (bactofilin family)